MEPYKTVQVIKERIWGRESWHISACEESIPVLIKFIDARDVLSVQVHPDDKYAAELERAQSGKTEMWLVLECGSDSEIVYGFKRMVGRSEVVERAEKELLTDVLNFVKVRKGDCIYIPAGTVHTLGGGMEVLEIQQPCDLTYRLYDWGRTDMSGNKRELHIEKAAHVIDYSNILPEIKNIYDSSDGDIYNIINCEHFSCCYRPMKYRDVHTYGRKGFKAVTLISGKASIFFENSIITLEKGDTCIIPEDYEGNVGIECLEDMECIETVCGI